MTTDHNSNEAPSTPIQPRHSTETVEPRPWPQPPWRQPADCLSGGLALAASIQFLLDNIVAARAVSFSNMYAITPDDVKHEGGSGGAAGRSNGCRHVKLRSESAQSAAIKAATGASLLDYAWHAAPDTVNANRTDILVSRGPSPFASCDVSPSRPTQPFVENGFTPPRCSSEAVSDTAARSPVPPIPLFSEVLHRKEELMREWEDEQSRTGELPAALTRTRGGAQNVRIPTPSSGDDNGDAEDHDGGGPPGMAGTARPDNQSVDGTASVGKRSTAGSRSYNEFFDDSTASMSHVSCTSSSSSASDDAMGSEGNFGQEGHLSCVPGDVMHNRYELIRQLGVGRSSRVWLAVDLEQCTPARRILIKEIGEAAVLRLFNPRERPLFVAIKVFRCGQLYTECAEYESLFLDYIMHGIEGVHKGSRRQSLDSCLTSLSKRSSVSTIMAVQSRSALDTAAHELPMSASASFCASSTRRDKVGSLIPMFAEHVATPRGLFDVVGDHGVHKCIVMDVAGTGVDAAINESRLQGLPADVIRSVVVTSLQGLVVLESLHVIHTDIKPENLLFIDLDEDIAQEMSGYQARYLHTAADAGALWTSSSHRRVSVAEYAPIYPLGGGVNHTAAGHVVVAHADEGGGVVASAHVSPRSLASRLCRRRSSLPSAVTVLRGECDGQLRTLYQTRVSDYGLSFLVPPALREGVDGLLRIVDELHESSRGGESVEGLLVEDGEAVLILDAADQAALLSELRLRLLLDEEEKEGWGSAAKSLDFLTNTSEAANNVSFESQPRLSHVNSSVQHLTAQLESTARGLRKGSTPSAALSSSLRRMPPTRRTSNNSSSNAAVIEELELALLRKQYYIRGVTVQSREYRSPEVILGGYFLPSCDVWSLGCVVYELVTGRFLFDSAMEYEREVQSQRQRDSIIIIDGIDGGDEECGKYLYIDCEEKDMDVVHLKCLMRLLGPPPLAWLHRRPVGRYVSTFFSDTDGRFLFADASEDEALGVTAAAPYRANELAAASLPRSNASSSRNSHPAIEQESATHPSPSHAADSANYPVVTAAWQRVRDELRHKLGGSEEEARSCEAFLLQCLQWDPAQRAKAFDLLQSDWLTKFGFMATAALGGERNTSAAAAA